MDKIRMVFKLCELNFRKWLSSTRIQIILLLIILMIYNYLEGVRLFASAVNTSMTPWSLPFLMTTFNSLIMIMLGFVFLFCDAPFLDEQQPYLVLRVGRKIFTASQVLYIFAASLVYTLFVFLSTIICSLPVSFSLSWGKIFKTLALTDAGSKFNVILNIPDSLMLHYTPLEAIGKQLLLLWLVGCFLGFLIFALNLYFSRAAGVVCASLFVFLDMFADFYQKTHGYAGNRIYFFSPVSWANLNIIRNAPAESLPTFSYILNILAASIAVFIIIIFAAFRKKKH